MHQEILKKQENLSQFLSIEETYKKFQTSAHGISEEEAKKRLVIYGRNEITTKKISSWFIFFRQFRSPLIYLLLVASLISLLLGQIIDATIVIIILLINSILGFFQEHRTEKILESLKRYIRVRAKVRRQGSLKEIDQSLLVPGDVVMVKEGDLIPADLRFFKSSGLMVSEEVLTGESYPVEKKSLETLSAEESKKNIGFSGSLVVGGEGEGIILATGSQTNFGKIAELTISTAREGAIEKSLFHLSNFILRNVLIVLAVIFILNIILHGFNVDVPEFLLFSVALAVSVVPEVLPLISTITISRGIINLAKKKVAVKRLSSIEDLGGIEILCSDKTGTLTKNVLEVRGCYGQDQEQLKLFGLLAAGFFSDEKKISHDPFDSAIWHNSLAETKNQAKNYKKIWERPFDPDKKSNALIVAKENDYFLIVRGAAEIIINLCPGIEKEEITEQVKKLGLSGQRTLAMAIKKIEKFNQGDLIEEKDLNYLGLFSFFDAPKPTTAATIEEAKKLGIKIKIITGDSPEVAEAVAKEIKLEIGQQVLIGDQIDQIKDEDLLVALENNNVFARILPKQKYKIIQTLQQKHLVGFLGEGINDAPSLKLANVAIVVDSGADVSKEAGDIILLEKDLKVVVEAIKEGRKIFNNIVKYVRYTLIANFGNFYSMALISLILPFLPMLATQILLVNLLSDLPMVAVSTDNVDSSEIKKPQRYNLREITFACIFLGLVSSTFDFMFFALFYNRGPEVFRTMWFVASILTELVLIISVRTKLPFYQSRPSKTLLIICLLAFLLTIFIPISNFRDIFHFVAPSLGMFLSIFSLVGLYFVVTELVKIFYYRRQREI